MQLLELNFNLKHTFSQKPKYIKKEYKTDSQMHTLNHNTNCYVRACTCIDGFYSLVITFYNTLMSKLDTKTLSDIQGLLRQAFHEQSIYVRIVVVRGGSVRVICCAPQYLMTELVRLAQKNRELLVESSVTYLRVGDTIVVDTSDQNEVRKCYHRNCVTFDSIFRYHLWKILSFN